MDRRIRYLGIMLVICFALLFFQLNNWQVRQSSALQKSGFQPSSQPDEFTVARGAILSSDGYVLAQSAPTNDFYHELREYPLGALAADVTGFYDTTASSDSGLENYYNSFLTQHQGDVNGVSQILTSHNGTDDVVTTLNVKLQKVAASELGTKIGAVVAMDPTNGNILAMYSNPTFNPNVLAGHNGTAVSKAYQTLQDSSDPSASPLINGVTQYAVAPGSTMKVITTAAMFDHDPQLTQKVWPVLGVTPLPDTNQLLHNFGGEKCGGPLAKILAVSCDTAYALAGVQLGTQNLLSEAEAFGFNKVPPIDLTQFGVTQAFPAQLPPKSLVDDIPNVAYSTIGQASVTETALQNVLVASAIANNGVMMTPHLMARIVNDQGTLVQTYQPKPYLTATSASTADQVRTLMLGVASGGTAAGLFPPSDDVAAKTGTAETGASRCSATWLIATAPAGPTDVPKIAVAAVVPAQSGVGCGETGAEVAGPIVSHVLEAGLKEGL